MEFIILKTKGWKKSKGCYPARVVLTAVIAGENREKDKHQHNAHTYVFEYTTHLQIDATSDNGKINLASGHYFTNIDDAIKDFNERL